MSEKTIAETARDLKKEIESKKSNHMNSDCAPIEYEKDRKITSVNIEVAENGFLVQANYNGKIIATSAKEAGEAVVELLS